ncbi:MAG TPA: alpha/beta hydrolase [Longimicrobiales bacterium]
MSTVVEGIGELPRDVAARVLRVGRGRAEYASCGEGPAVLCLHGAMGGYDQSHLLARTIGEPGYRFISVSRPGYLGTPLASGRSPEEQADLYAALLDELQVRDVAVMAVSGGGPSALHFALRHRSRCRALVLVSTVAGSNRQGPPLSFGVTSMLLRLPAFAARVRRKTEENFERVLERSIPDPALRARTVADPFALALLRELTLGMFERAGERVAGTWNDVRVARSTEYALERIEVPTLVLHGDGDHTAPFEHGRSLAARIPGARLVVAAGGDHVSIFTHRQQLRGEVTRFLRETSAG